MRAVVKCEREQLAGIGASFAGPVDALHQRERTGRQSNACGGRGALPIKFNGSIFTVDTGKLDADFRQWGGCYWFQNTRLAYWPMILWALVIGLDITGMVLMNALIGAGDTRRSMWISVIAQWVFFLPFAYIAGPGLGYGLMGIWVVNSIYRTGQAVVCVQSWAARRWVGIKL